MSVANVLTQVMEFMAAGNWMHCSDYLIFGWKEYLEDTGGDVSLDVSDPDQAKAAKIAELIWHAKQVYLPSDEALTDWTSKVTTLLRTEEGEQLLEAAIARDLIKEIRGIVKRHTMLDPLHVDSPLLGNATKYFYQAIRSYLMGLNVAAVLLCRSTLEMILEQKLLELDPDFWWKSKPKDKGKLQWLIDEAGGLKLFRQGKNDYTPAAHEFRAFSNKVVHEGLIPGEDETRSHLEGLRTLGAMIMRSRGQAN